MFSDMERTQFEEEEFFDFTEGDREDESDRVFDLELSYPSQVEISGEDKENEVWQILRAEKKDNGAVWKKKYEDEVTLREKEKEQRTNAEENLKHSRSRACCRKLRLELRKAKRRCLEKEVTIKKIGTYSISRELDV